MRGWMCVARVRRRVKYDGYVMRISNIENQKRGKMLSLDRYRTEYEPETTRQTDRYMWSVKSNVVFADVRYNWELFCDGFIVRGARSAAAIFPHARPSYRSVKILRSSREYKFLNVETRPPCN